MSTAEFEAKWAKLKSTIDKLFRLESFNNDLFLEIYRSVFHLCVMASPNRGRDLYDRTKKRIEEQLGMIADKILTISAPLDFIQQYAEQWGNFKVCVNFLNLCYAPMNQQWVKNHLQDLQRRGKKDEVFTIKIMAFRAWKEALLDPVKERLRQAVFELLNAERKGETVETETIRRAIESYLYLGQIKEQSKQLDIYKVEFEAQFLDDTKAFFEAETTAFLTNNNVASYLMLAEKRLDEELARARIYLDPSSYERHADIINETLVTMHKERLQNEVPVFLQETRIEDLRRMFRLMNRIEDGIRPMLNGFFDYIKKIGADSFGKILPDYELSQKKATSAAEHAEIRRVKEELPKKYVDVFLNLQKQCAEMCEVAFQRHPKFVASLDKGMSSVLNLNCIQRPNDKNQPSPYYAARYAHQILTDKRVQQDMLPDLLDGVCNVYRYLEYKAAFHHYHKTFFSQRLLLRTATSRDAELMMIDKLRNVDAEYSFISSLNRMISDMEEGDTLSGEYKAKANPKIDVAVMVGTRGSWPISAEDMTNTLTLPPELSSEVKHFTEFYEEKYDNRRLFWLHAHSKAIVTTEWTQVKYRVTVNHYQAAVLLTFNAVTSKSGAIKHAELMAALECDVPYVNAALESLIKKPINLIQRKPDTGDISKAMLRLNPKFRSKRKAFDATGRFINPNRVASDPGETDEMIESRKLAYRAAVVRIMKSKKKYDHQKLVNDCVAQTSRWFPTKVPDIKREIEWLLHHDPPYLKRLDNRTYEYLS
mmetsp:Transcript_9898/g.14924  ORF Transcript_9898/g.14924 Transcript_9898/m.14924 type:complete len:763 (+) Transcript_9898:39-2327(+)|eukprot:CAMPEP_0201547224 /NCGR_PEP_ID=MMETSP0173_2-20130828/3671_1 /ASSEMBLY_ACC=CAM_ASM_000268 /TAXON_ID=218659 /ORGANISM="Vexillifera sp., Strain DIVA3 564/2" /LENGTH=762 /DNA_ID=CAMNT_0047956209 /DNA_START=22 /DNA_END=2310 /DNA_ORIENTATION=-